MICRGEWRAGPTHSVIINDRPWDRRWGNRTTYTHPYSVQRYEAPRRVQQHPLHERTQRERQAEQKGRRVEEHREGRAQGRGQGRGEERR